LRNFTLPVKRGVLQQEFLFVDKTWEIAIRSFDYTTLIITSFIGLVFFTYTFYLCNIIIF
jgi:hypothetical protein